MKQHYDVIILGAGISGMTAASIYSEQPELTILLLDQYESLGGNHKSYTVGEYSFDIGSFLFHEGSPFFERFPVLRDECVPFEGSTGRLNPQARLARYPFDPKVDLVQAGPYHLLRMACSLLRGRLMNDPDRSAFDFVVHWLGHYMAARTGLIAYLERFYGIDPRQVEGSFAKKRMQWISRNASLKGLLGQLAARDPVEGKSIARPRTGFAPYYAKAGQALKARGVDIALGGKIERIHKGYDGEFILTMTDREICCSKIISTMPLEIVSRLCGLSGSNLVVSSRLTSMFYSFSGHRGFPHNVLYNFTDDGFWKRLTMHSDCYGRVGDREYFSLEIISRDVTHEIEALDRDFRRHCGKFGIFEGDLRLEGFEHTENAYPIYLQGATEAAARLVEQLREFGIHSFGRQGGFDYQPTSHISVVTAERAVASIRSAA